MWRRLRGDVVIGIQSLSPPSVFSTGGVHLCVLWVYHKRQVELHPVASFVMLFLAKSSSRRQYWQALLLTLYSTMLSGAGSMRSIICYCLCMRIRKSQIQHGAAKRPGGRVAETGCAFTPNVTRGSYTTSGPARRRVAQRSARGDEVIRAEIGASSFFTAEGAVRSSSTCLETCVYCQLLLFKRVQRSFNAGVRAGLPCYWACFTWNVCFLGVLPHGGWVRPHRYRSRHH